MLRQLFLESEQRIVQAVTAAIKDAAGRMSPAPSGRMSPAPSYPCVPDPSYPYESPQQALPPRDRPSESPELTFAQAYNRRPESPDPAFAALPGMADSASLQSSRYGMQVVPTISETDIFCEGYTMAAMSLTERFGANGFIASEDSRFDRAGATLTGMLASEEATSSLSSLGSPVGSTQLGPPLPGKQQNITSVHSCPSLPGTPTPRHPPASLADNDFQRAIDGLTRRIDNAIELMQEMQGVDRLKSEPLPGALGAKATTSGMSSQGMISRLRPQSAASARSARSGIGSKKVGMGYAKAAPQPSNASGGMMMSHKLSGFSKVSKAQKMGASVSHVSKTTGTASRMMMNASGAAVSVVSAAPPPAAKMLWEHYLDYVSLVVIFVNTIWLGCEAEARMQAAIGEYPVPDFLRVVNGSFALVFFLELTMKVILLRGDIWRKDKAWNAFDAMLVLSSIADFVVEFMSLGFMRTMRILRAVRTARMFRVVGYVQHLRLMVAAMATSFPTLVWAMILLCLLLYLCALVLLLGVEASIRASAADQELLDNFGSLGITTITLFMSISGGIDWGELLHALQKLHVVYAPFFAIWVGFASFSVVGVLTAVIIEASSSILQVDKDLVIDQIIKEDKAKANYLRQLFLDMDTDGNKTVSEDELEKALEKEETMALLKKLDLDVSRAQNLFAFLDEDGSGEVAIDEFVEGLMKCRGIAMIVDENQRLSENMAAEIVSLRDEIRRYLL